VFNTGSFLSPGSVGTPGTLNLTVTEALDLSPLAGHGAGRLIFRLGSVSDSLAVTGGGFSFIGVDTLVWDDFAFTTVSGFGGGTYVLISSADGWFGSVGDLSGEIDGLDATISLNGNDLVLTVIPEPATVTMMFGLLAAGILWFRKRRKHLS
jgi:hypothetical protein